MYQKAEALYAKGDFEMALVFYHRGNKLRPELDEFRLGIQKAREAIDNSIGNPKDYKFRAPENFSLNAIKRQASPLKSKNAQKKSMKPVEKSPTTSISTTPVRKSISRTDSTTPTTPECDVKQLLGELYTDKEYLEQLMNDEDFISNPNSRIMELVSEGLKYLEARTEFWRQQKPIYARRKEASKIRMKMANARLRQLEREQKKQEEKLVTEDFRTKKRTSMSPSKTKPEIDVQTILMELEMGNYQKTLELGEMYLKNHKGSKSSKSWKIHLQMGHAYLHLKKPELAETEYLMAMEEPGHQNEVLGHLGRSLAKQKKFEEAIKYWGKLLNMDAVTTLEKTWLSHDISRCHLAMGHQEKAKTMMNRACQYAIQLNDPKWLLNSNILAGQIYAEEKNFSNSLESYEKALKFAVNLKDTSTAKTIEKAIEDLKISTEPFTEAPASS
ncbi:Tetratricopeptide repeat protein 25 [Coelomomyces lativittatus]|nr:Tetratricopeptide repeat protein 25 [Coelomomyces lativittatus]